MRTALLTCLVLLVACGDSEAPDNSDSGSGAGNDAATTGGTGGNAGDGDGDGDGDDASVGGTGGGGGIAALPNECETDSDCKLAGGCCDCVAVPNDTTVGSCRSTCDEDRCTQLGVSAICAHGRCTFDATCDDSNVTCERLPPECPPGERAIVQGDCWGDCIDVRECNGVTSCDACTDDQACASPGVMLPAGLHCWDVPPACNGTASCECLGDQICDFTCSDDPQPPDGGPIQLGCFCVTC